MRCLGREFTNKLCWALLLLSCASSVGCVSGNWSRESRYTPPDLAALAELEAGSHSLTDCLEQLGAPLWVWEAADGRSALAWGWLSEEGLGFRASIPLSDSTSGTFTFNNVDQDMQGIVLFFDVDWKLVATRRGLLRDLTQIDARKRPALVDNSES